MGSPAHRWRFFRAGGFDQVRLDRGADLTHLAELDQKLWVALSCPTQGVELDPQTLAMIDVDADGHVRAPELMAAVSWAAERLKSADTLVAGGALDLSAIQDQGEVGPRLLATAQRVLASLGKADATAISVEDCADHARIFAGMAFNGDGVIAPAGQDAELQAAMTTIMDALGGVADRSGEMGVNRATVERFFSEGAALRAWREDGAAQVPGLADAAATAAAFEALRAVSDKVDDFFMRCHLAAFDPRASQLLNGSEDDLRGLGGRLLAGAAQADLAALPLAYVQRGAALPLAERLNPAWTGAMTAFVSRVVQPLLGDVAELTEPQWRDLRARFSAHEAWVAAQPATVLVKLDALTLNGVMDSGVQARLLALIDQDEAAAEEAALMQDVERLVRYVRDLARLANNFVSFSDFYSGRARASFQAGTLYLDGRSCDLCVKVLDPARHATLAALSGVYLAYCECTRGGEKMTIAAAVTAGDADQLMVGRNGVFYDRQGRDWDATITKIVDHPISIRQAFWTPYKKVARLVGEQVQKLAAAKSKSADDLTSQAVLKAGDKVSASAAQAGQPAATPTPAPAPFDAAKFAGIFAAVGLAIGAIGTALASVVTGFLGLRGWQMPLALLGLMLLVSGPAMAMAYFKLRNRNLGPILDANGWAINTRARINIPFGTALTQLASLPDGAERALTDPYAEKQTPWKTYLLLAAILAGAVTYVIWAGGIGAVFSHSTLQNHP
jgi:hypothetical protein